MFTERERKVLRFALSRFYWDSMSQMNAAAQDKDGQVYKKEAVKAFHQDAKDAEALLEKIKEKNK